MNGLRKVPMYRALFRDHLLMGCDRELLIFVSLITGFMCVMVMRPIGFLLAAIFFLVSVYLLRLMGKADPMMRQVFLRNVNYREYYPTASRPYRDAKGGRDY